MENASVTTVIHNKFIGSKFNAEYTDLDFEMHQKSVLFFNCLWNVPQLADTLL